MAFTLGLSDLLGKEHNGDKLQAEIQAELTRRKTEVIKGGAAHVAHNMFRDNVQEIAPAHNDGDKLKDEKAAEVKANANKALTADYFKVIGDALKESKLQYWQSLADDGAKGGNTDGVDPAKK